MDVRDICPLTRQLCESSTQPQPTYDVPQGDEAVVLAACTYRMWERMYGNGRSTSHTIDRLAAYFAQQTASSHAKGQAEHVTDHEDIQQPMLYDNDDDEEDERKKTVDDGGLATFIASMPMSVDDEEEEKVQDKGPESVAEQPEDDVQQPQEVSKDDDVCATPQTDVQPTVRTPSAVLTTSPQTVPAAASTASTPPRYSVHEAEQHEQDKQSVAHALHEAASAPQTPSPLPHAAQSPSPMSHIESNTHTPSSAHQEAKAEGRTGTSVSAHIDFDEQNDIKSEEYSQQQQQQQEQQPGTTSSKDSHAGLSTPRVREEQRAASMVVQQTTPLQYSKDSTPVSAQTSQGKKARRATQANAHTPSERVAAQSKSHSPSKQLVFTQHNDKDLVSASRSPRAVPVKQEDLTGAAEEVHNSTRIGEEQPRRASSSCSSASPSQAMPSARSMRTHSTRIAEAELLFATQQQRMQRLHLESAVSPVARLRGCEIPHDGIGEQLQQQQQQEQQSQKKQQQQPRSVTSSAGREVSAQSVTSMLGVKREAGVRRAGRSLRGGVGGSSASISPIPHPGNNTNNGNGNEFDLPHTSPSPLPALYDASLQGVRRGGHQEDNAMSVPSVVHDVTHDTPWQSLMSTAEKINNNDNNTTTATHHASSLAPRVMHNGPRRLKRKAGATAAAIGHAGKSGGTGIGAAEAEEFALPRSFVPQGNTAVVEAVLVGKSQRDKSAGHKTLKRRRQT